jgi:hypothetical protein
VFALEVNNANFGVDALTPGEFVIAVLPKHVDYPFAED